MPVRWPHASGAHQATGEENSIGDARVAITLHPLFATCHSLLAIHTQSTERTFP
jgi:hypothetical protein